MNRYKNFDWSSVGLDFGNWEEEKIWRLELPIVSMNIRELSWHFDVPFWSDDNGERWAITPWDVVHGVSGSIHEKNNVEKADTAYPIDIFENKGKWLVLDGLHRLVKEYQKGSAVVQVRKIPHDRFAEIKSDYPIELPDMPSQ